ncbi:fumarylacetoacetate hydrolase family protein [Methanocella paludicola SANAE]|uniref:Fumarylacetoacetate hydrolase family protein n=1 Tax=Methanocella paludicola (strain DSM 17711 / JCM 13418 / NBRC 101707 / SANAE) TaxID=304371 RepID=D1YYV1_METPS|nr:fumarylacetoacetate hydrolase family protein [Methanocella paludicola]BAI61623.1 fumarylacetoacetate hydrolase family protein [Methanocella paludicola SANAE]
MTFIGRFRYHHRVFTGEVFEGKVHSTLGGKEYRLEDLKVLPPCTPTKIVCVGCNYVEHAKELNERIPEEPILFLKPPSSLLASGDGIVYPKQSQRVDYEAELAVVIGRRTRHVKADKAKSHIMGYTCFNDVTARDLQRKDIQWTRAKSFDTFSPVGPFIATDVDPLSIGIKSRLNGKIMQDSNTGDMIFNVYKLVEFISGVMTLEAGDVIATGTPPGVGPMKPGDVVEVEIESIGTLKNKVVS